VAPLSVERAPWFAKGSEKMATATQVVPFDATLYQLSVTGSVIADHVAPLSVERAPWSEREACTATQVVPLAAIPRQLPETGSVKADHVEKGRAAPPASINCIVPVM
jgi:hypothetical protein